MKRFLLVIPAILFILLNACGSPNISPAELTATAQVQSAAVLTPISGPTATPDPRSSQIFAYLNLALENMETSTKFDQLEHITGASYQVINVDLPPETNMTPVFRVDVRCECAVNARCCSPTRTFVVLLMAINNMGYRDSITNTIGQMPVPVSQMEVWIYDHSDLTDVIYVPWNDVKLFLEDRVGGFELASEITPVHQP